eukprot:CAMPEP_0174708102 /NCGR_PEP_ID=MMETSP1094-20130205/10446_1 /TAXON_ID=156173 /ORGANISM="Chrysochromulina brevifilum, Strain UTEX LB 985" /LENGTH=177 /DNA_ID=CAMNT_0015906607 /DNA_START=24 /DNA_END=554 /DNA_ORIENTATION=+
MTQFFQALPEDLIQFRIRFPLPRLPPELTTFKNLRRIQTLDLSESVELTALPVWLPEMRQLETLKLNGCVNLNYLPHTLPNLYNKYKRMLFDFTGCASLFHGLPKAKVSPTIDAEYVDDLPMSPRVDHGKSAKSKAARTPFCDPRQLEIISELMNRAEKDLASDQLVILDGRGVAFA